MKYAKVSGLVRWSGGSTVLSAGVTTADDDHPLVLERPDLFTDETPAAHLSVPRKAPELAPEAAPVERATRAPGEKRQTRRG
ncbi:hypothetical protein ABZ738_05525 [Micromonospora sp. NPDC047793]|uniref:hypothetical protein n=1 Tax=Micromonospora sp. NPDC047793 TaxID=3154342 RepID=UPI0033D31B69